MVEAAPHHRFAALDALRGVAALVLAAEHLNALGPVFGLQFFRNGLYFVDFFFALSGFVIAASYAGRLRAGFPPLRFLWLRVGRVWPVHGVMLAAYLAIELLVWLTASSTLTGREAFGPARQPAHLLPQILLVHSVYTPALYSWLLQSWSISVEMMLYAVAALGWSLLGRWWWQLWLVLGLLAAAIMLFPDAIGLHHKLMRGFAGFGMGVVAYAVWQRWGGRMALLPGALFTALELACAMAIVAAVQTAGDDPVFGLYALGFAFTVLVFAAGRGALSQLLLGRVPVFLGTVSYSLYMVHSLAESAVASLLARGATLLGHGWIFAAPPGNNRPAAVAELGLAADLVSATVLGAAVLAAWIMYRLVEEPARLWSRKVAARVA